MPVANARSFIHSAGRRFLLLTLLVQILTLAISSALILIPITQRAVDDLAALMVLSAQTWIEVPDTRHDGLRNAFRTEHQLNISETAAPQIGTASHLPYLLLLSHSLSSKLQQSITVQTDSGQDYWVDLPIDGVNIHIAFERERIGTAPFTAMLIVAAAGLMVSLSGARWLKHTLRQPISHLTAGMAEVARGARPQPLPDDGPIEFSTLTRGFNRMVEDVHAQNDNRTTLLAGISHDLRTPLARLRMALGLADAQLDPEHFTRMTRYIDEMNSVIDGFLTYSRSSVHGEQHSLELHTLIQELAGSYQCEGQPLTVDLTTPITLTCDPVALRRLLGNVLDNAVRYANGEMIDVILMKDARGAAIEIHDRGPGIADALKQDVFRPFFRSEASRNSRSGGTGLGLAIVAEIARLHGWEVQLLDRPGGGLSVRIAFNLR